VSRDYDFEPGHFFGDVVCFGSMILFSVYLVLGRRGRALPSVWAYVVPLYAVAAVASLVGWIGQRDPLARLGEPRELLLALGLALVPTVLGHSALNFAMAHFRGQFVSIANLSQPLFAGLAAFVLFAEVPNAAAYPACLLVVAGAIVSLRSGAQNARA
jgi:drug/metabolite transporter (DMT)-like permease